ncbi:unnamed protein product [Ranitomeya imitator]|uniref:Reverse transcriptase domain-containing protein n=1 Tax=Ranitomeya imitator TaxID=111125 RepID=A0ABN9MG57_9NEOB|nr:unnamed protein product [Ranitomeya imitator]
MLAAAVPAPAPAAPRRPDTEGGEEGSTPRCRPRRTGGFLPAPRCEVEGTALLTGGSAEGLLFRRRALGMMSGLRRAGGLVLRGRCPSCGACDGAPDVPWRRLLTDAFSQSVPWELAAVRRRWRIASISMLIPKVDADVASTSKQSVLPVEDSGVLPDPPDRDGSLKVSHVGAVVAKGKKSDYLPADPLSDVVAVVDSLKDLIAHCQVMSTFSYNAEETTNILARSTFNSDFLKITPREIRGRDLERELRHFINIELHCATLTEYLREQRNPRGLRVPLRPTLFRDCSEYCTKYEHILNKCSFDIITLTIEHLQKAIAISSEAIKSIEAQLSSSGTPEELTTLRDQISKNIEKHRRETEERKRIKFNRDTEDYERQQVYRWQDSFFARRIPTRQVPRTSLDYSTSGSEQEQGTSVTLPPRFLGHQQRYPRRRQRGGATDIRKDPDQARITRSQCHTFDLEMDLRFFRSLRLKAFFATSPEPAPTPSTPTTLDHTLSSRSLGLYTKRHFRPPHGSHAMESFIGFVQDSFRSLREDIRRGRLCYPSNLSNTERQALQGLQNDKNLIIKPADKGGALVVMNKSDYLLEIRRQLDNPTIYVKLPRDPTAATRQLISDTLLKYTELGILDPKTCEFLTNPHPIIPVFNTIPKIHKNLEKPPGRPIVASTDSILSPLAVYLEKILTPLIRLSKSFILDTGSFLNILKELGSIPTGAILVTMDVKDLYTSIPHIEGINSVHKLLTKSNFLPDQINLCVELLTIILTRNYFMFQDDFYLQVRGTAMGSNVAPPYANSYMADFEESHIYSHSSFRNNVIVWKRYIDDVFCIWGGTLESLASFFDWLNTAWPGISFTMSHDLTRINFLDTMVILQSDGSISTDLYTKSTDRNSLLHFTSFHTPATKKSVPKSQFQRVSKIVSDGELRSLRLQEMTAKFSQRGYPPSI